MTLSSLRTYRRPLVVGLALREGQDTALLASCVSLAQHLQVPLELVHALESPPCVLGAADFPYYSYEKALNEVDETLARRRLDALMETLPSELKVRSHVLREEPSAALCTVASEVRAGLVVCGLQSQNARAALKGLSTAFSLVTTAEWPVMILPREVNLDFRESPSMLIVDNFELEGRFALENALRLAEELESRAITHVHVHPRSCAATAKSLAQVELDLQGDSAAQPLHPELYIERLRCRIVDDLLYRFHNCEGAQHLQVSYQAAAGFGDVAEELHRLLQETSARLVVFGRHFIVHKKALALGKVAFMASNINHAAAIIVPDAERQTIPRFR